MTDDSLQSLVRVGVPSSSSSWHEREEEPVKVRFRVHPHAILGSLRDTIEEIEIERDNAFRQMLNASYDIADYASEVNLREEKATGVLPVPFVPTEDWEKQTRLLDARRRFDAVNRELWYYKAYVKYVTSRDSVLEIEPATTTFFVEHEEIDEYFEDIDEEEEDNVFAQAEQRQRELLSGIKIDDDGGMA
jgi:hypothetical protein